MKCIGFLHCFLQAFKQLSALSGQPRGRSLDSLARAMGVAQHHDAVSGTAKQHVTDDYVLRLSEAAEKGHDTVTRNIR